jgi:hypothetical protein
MVAPFEELTVITAVLINLQNLLIGK